MVEVILVVQIQILLQLISKKNEKIENDSKDRLDRYKYLYRNDVYLYRREGIKGFIYEAGRITAHCLRVIFKSKDSKMDKLKIIIGSTIKGFSFKPEIEFVGEQND